MFVNCPNCAVLVATDLATDLPPERCPRCGFALREAIAPAAASSVPAEPPAPIEPIAPPSTAPADCGTDMPADTAADTADTSAAADRDDALPVPERAPSDDTAANAESAAKRASKQESPKTPATPAPAAAGDAARHVKPAPSFAQRHLRTAAGAQALRRRWPAVAAVVALTLLLALQLLLADRARIAADPQWRPLLAAVCDTIGCTLPPWREPESIALLQRDVRPHAELAGVLRVNATIRNDARWTQAWPHLVLRLSDIDGRTLGQRRFSPEEYLEQPPAPAGMSSGQRATIRIDVLEPSPHTVAFNFDFD